MKIGMCFNGHHTILIFHILLTAFPFQCTTNVTEYVQEFKILARPNIPPPTIALIAIVLIIVEIASEAAPVSPA